MPHETWDIYGSRQQDMLGKKAHKGYSAPFYGEEAPFLVKDLAESWFLDIKDTMSMSTYDRYHKYVEKFILPYVGNMRAEVFDKTALLAMLALLRGGHSQKKPLSQYTVYFVETMVRAMFRYGVEKGLVPEVYFGKSEYKIQSKRYAMPLTELEMLQLVHVVEQKELDFQVQILLPLYTGLSLSELCGLKWEDIDMENRKIHIHRNLVRVQRRNMDAEDEASSNDSATKSKSSNSKEKSLTALAECELPEASCREFTMPKKVYELLSAVEVMKKPEKDKYVAELDKKKKDKKKNVSMEVSVAEVEENKKTCPPDSKSLQYRLRTAGEEAGISNLTYQTIRDTFAMLSLNAGGDAYSVAYVMGVSASVVCDRYGLWLVKNDDFMKDIG